VSGIVWLASYPKSGSTWLRVLLSNYLSVTEEPVDINHLTDGPIASARVWFDEWAGVEASSLPPAAIDHLRPEVYRCLAGDTTDMLFMKVHDMWQVLDTGQAMFPADVTIGVVYIVRNPLDMACSLANHYGITAEGAVEKLCGVAPPRTPLGLPNQLRQHLGSWSEHVRSWVDESGLAVHTVRFEDLVADTVGMFEGMVRFARFDLDPDRARQAVTSSQFTELQRQEASGGFRERPPSATVFFRRGQVGAWRQELPARLVSRLVDANSEMMGRFGYLPTGRVGGNVTARSPATHDPWPASPPVRTPNIGRAPNTLGVAETTVTFGPVRTTLTPCDHRGVLWQASERRLLLTVPGVARYLVEEGSRVTVDPAPQADDAEVWRFARTTPVAALWLQRGLPVLHAATAVSPSVRFGRSEAVLIAGDSASGKSVLLAELLRRGWDLLADDLTPITLDHHGTVLANPTGPELWLWPDAIERAGGCPVGENRRLLDVDRIAESPIPLTAIWWLGTHNHDHIHHTPVEGVGRFEALGKMAYNSRIASAVLDRGQYLRVAGSVARAAIPIRRLLRPRGCWTEDKLADLVEAALFARSPT